MQHSRTMEMSHEGIVVRPCEPNELSAALGRLDQEFVSQKQRSLSLGRRFPNTISLENIGHIHVAVSGARMCGAYAVRMFDWIVYHHEWRGAMIGLVWVDPLQRGQGIGQQLMMRASQSLREQAVDFGVLWTGRPSLYERSGWISHDRGLLGEATKCRVAPCTRTVNRQDVTAVETTWLETIRSRFHPLRVRRTPLDYRTVPIPALQVSCFSAQHRDAGDGFALVGDVNGTGYFYEMAAPKVLWEVIWTAVAGHFDRLVVNGHLGDPFAQWLADGGQVEWQPQNKTMWLRVSRRSETVSTATWHIPYFDWI
jgi:hypothetical protein